MFAADRAISIPEFCAALGFSRGHFYNLAKVGRAPRVTKIGRRSVVLADDARNWVAALHSPSAAPVLPPPPIPLVR